MKVGPETKVYDILSTYPFIKEYLIKLDPHFKKLDNPVMMQTMGRIATLRKAAEAVNISVDALLSGIADEIRNRTGEAIERDG